MVTVDVKQERVAGFLQPLLSAAAGRIGRNNDTILKILNQIGLAFVQITKRVLSLPQALANLSIERRQRVALDKLEVERLDRIRNPEKYRGKEL